MSNEVLFKEKPNELTQTLEIADDSIDVKRIVKEQPVLYRIFKRINDVLLSLLGLLVLSPLFILLGILIKIEDPKGPVFFSQVRVGKNGEKFKMYKFRSMIKNAEEVFEDLKAHNEIEGHMFKMKNDPRVTKIGKIIRKTSLDELPQLFNVVKGDMSLVGPRPPLEREVNNYSSYHMQRLNITPGCTGLWQVSARNEIDFEGMVALDLLYSEKNSLLYDYFIIFMTFKSIFRGSGY